MARMTGGQAVVESLIAQGVDTVFGVISVHTLHIFDALRAAVEQGRLRFIGGRHEHALGCMADGFARASGRPGVLLTSSGPGAADSVGAMGEAYHSSVPVLQITTEIEREWLNRDKGLTHDAKDQLTMFASVADWRSLADSVESVPDHIAGALEHQRTHHPRPAVVEVPTDLLAEEADVEVVPKRVVKRPQADPAAVAQAAHLLRTARRPLLWGGGGVMTADASPELRELAERLQAPVVTGDGGKGAFPEDHPLALGTALGNHIWGHNPIHDYIASCDTVLVVGSSLSFRTTRSAELRLPPGLVQIDVDPAMIGRNYPAALGLVGDAKTVLRQVLDALDDGSPTAREEGFHAELRALKAEVYASVQQAFPNEQRLWEGIRSVLDRDAVVVTDSTLPAYCAPRCFPVYEPRTLYGPHGWVSIGYGFAASLGAKAALPGRQVVCVTGDGGFQYNLQELATAVQYGLAPVVLLFNDNAWGVLKRYQQRRFQKRYFEVDLQNPDFCKLAEVYGAEAARVETLEQLLTELERSLFSARIQLIEVATPEGIDSFR